jgi:hypothetical protein
LGVASVWMNMDLPLAEQTTRKAKQKCRALA